MEFFLTLRALRASVVNSFEKPCHINQLQTKESKLPPAA
jgi:hypothetical protein